MSDLLEQFRQLGETNVTKTVHQKPYPALSFMRPEMSQAGRVVLIPGGGANIGHSIARSFIRASADTVIIIGRRAEVLRSAGSRLEEEAKLAGTGTKIITRSFDVVNIAEVEAFWRDLADQGITVDVLVANVAKSPEPKSIIELGADEVWSFMEINVRSPLYFAEKFFSQPGGTGKQKVSHFSLHCGHRSNLACTRWMYLTNRTHSSSSTCQLRRFIRRVILG